VVLFTNEENGGKGGKGYRDAHLKEIKHVVAALESDTGSGAPLGWSIDIRRKKDKVKDKDLAQAAAALIPIQRLLEPLGAGVLRPGGSGADVGPTVAEGPMGLGLIHDMTGYWPIHHTRADTMDKVDPDLVAKNVAVVAVTAWMLADAEDPGIP
jgi:carboxypeptidase Q